MGTTKCTACPEFKCLREPAHWTLDIFHPVFKRFSKTGRKCPVSKWSNIWKLDILCPVFECHSTNALFKCKAWEFKCLLDLNQKKISGSNLKSIASWWPSTWARRLKRSWSWRRGTARNSWLPWWTPCSRRTTSQTTPNPVPSAKLPFKSQKAAIRWPATSKLTNNDVRQCQNLCDVINECPIL